MGSEEVSGLSERRSNRDTTAVEHANRSLVGIGQSAFRDVPAQAFTIFLAHSPEAYQQAAQCQAQLYLCGHTHGGQICLPERGPILTNSRAPRFTASGSWQYRNMQGYTSRGAGPSGIPLRFNCPGEIALITLVKGELKAENSASAE